MNAVLPTMARRCSRLQAPNLQFKKSPLYLKLTYVLVELGD